MSKLVNLVRLALDRFGIDVARQDNQFLEPEFQEIYRRCYPFTMVSRERLYAHFQAVQYVVRKGLPGDIVECGVWRGGTSMVGALTLRGMGDTSRKIWLYDTFAGMTAPTDADTSPWDGEIAKGLWKKNQGKDANSWCYAPVEEVRENMLSTGYPAQNINSVKGDVLQTLSGSAPAQIAVLRLDTDWYESTLKCLEELYPRLVPGGVLLIDDYGAWAGCRKAVTEYCDANNIALLLHRTDYTGRSAIKP